MGIVEKVRAAWSQNALWLMSFAQIKEIEGEPVSQR